MITRDELQTIARNGIWKQNTSIAQILGLCPLLAVTTNAVNGIMLSGARPESDFRRLIEAELQRLGR